MRILFAGATGVLGRATLPHLRGHETVGLIRSADELDLVRELGAEGVVCDVYDAVALRDVAERTRPQLVVNFVTALAGWSSEANNRVRRIGGRNLLDAAEAANAPRVVVESVAFKLDGDGGEAVEELERATREFPGQALIVRFGRLWGPGTRYEEPPAPPAVHIEQAGAEAARLLVDASPGTYVVA